MTDVRHHRRRAEAAPGHDLRRIGGDDEEQEERDERLAEKDQRGLPQTAEHVAGQQYACFLGKSWCL